LLDEARVIPIDAIRGPHYPNLMAERDNATLELQRTAILELLRGTTKHIGAMSLHGFGAIEPRLRECIAALADCVSGKPPRSN
jgi:hypothetical protein